MYTVPGVFEMTNVNNAEVSQFVERVKSDENASHTKRDIRPPLTQSYANAASVRNEKINGSSKGSLWVNRITNWQAKVD